MSNKTSQEKIKAFVERWTGKGYEKGESQMFWIELLTDVLGVETPSEIISFEDQVKLDHTSFFDTYIKTTHVMTSLEIAELTAKQHKNVMQARNMEPAWEKVNGLKFQLVEYQDKKGESRPCYQLTNTECLYIATKFNDEARAKLVRAGRSWRRLRWEGGWLTQDACLQPKEILRLGSRKGGGNETERAYPKWIGSFMLFVC